MRKRILSLLLAFLMTLSFVTVGAQENVNNDQLSSQVYSAGVLKSLIKSYSHELADNYYYGVSDAQLLYSALCSTIEEGKFDLNKAIKNMIEALEDEHAAYYTQSEYEKLMEDVTGEFSGIGVMMTVNEKGALITDVISDSAAFASGIKSGDIITAVDDKVVEGMSADAIKNLVVGADGTSVKITVLRSGKPLDFTCIRKKVSVSNIETDMVTDDIAYIRIIQFAQNTPEEVEAYLKEIQAKSVKKLIIDLRNNLGGDLSAAQKIANIFISAGRLGELRYKNESLNQYVKSTNYKAPRIKIAVLVNEYSASASEFLAMAFQGRGAGKLIGTKTFGKGSMQIVRKLALGGGMKYTIGEFYTNKGERVHKVGITPDIVVQNSYTSIDADSFKLIDYNRIEEAGKDGEMTLALEQRLDAIGLFKEEPDEKFDENTIQAVKELQISLGYEATGMPGFYEYLYLNDLNYDFDVEIDNQKNAAIEYLKK